MASFKRLTDVEGPTVDVNMDAVIEMRQFPEDGYTVLSFAVSRESGPYQIAVAETPDEILLKPLLHSV
jgi:hypothetical protein